MLKTKILEFLHFFTDNCVYCKRPLGEELAALMKVCIPTLFIHKDVVN